MLPMMHILAQQDLFKKIRVWCPLCYQEWANTKRPIYDPLLWSLNVVSHCPVHKQPLNYMCPNPDCHKQIRKYGLPGICPYCEQWLGVASSVYSNDINDNRNDEWVSWVNENCMGLLEGSSQIDKDWAFDNKLRVCLNDVLPDELEMFAFARKLGIHPTRMSQFCNGHDRPSLEILLKISFNLRISLEQMFLSKKKGDSNRRRRSGTAYGPVEIQQKLLDILKADKDIPSTIEQLAKRVGCARSTLRKYVPNANQLLDEARKKTDSEYLKKTANRPVNLSKSEIHKTLLLELESKEPKCLAEIARNLGRHPTTLKGHFPELCKQIVNRYREQHLEKKEQLIKGHPLEKHQSLQKKFGTASRKLKISKETMEYELLSTLKKPSPIPLEHIAQSLEISSNNLRNHFPDISKQIVTRYKTYIVQQRQLNLEKLRSQLEHHLESNEAPLPLEKIASIYNVNPRHYYKHFPEKAHRISHLYLEYRKESSSQDHLLLKTIKH
ncbi:hypothetical protein GCM10025859_35340 [Alicyclobacillus fastidiosus]|nr:hypothetical protein GCM10025859_35340 [Alicyclobacillus fastidiosus]